MVRRTIWLVAFGFLGMGPVIIAVDSYGSVTDNAQSVYEFSLIELRMPAKGDGEGKASLTGTITIDPGSKGPALEGYDALPVTLRAVQARNES